MIPDVGEEGPVVLLTPGLEPKASTSEKANKDEQPNDVYRSIDKPARRVKKKNNNNKRQNTFLAILLQEVHFSISFACLLHGMVPCLLTVALADCGNFSLIIFTHSLGKKPTWRKKEGKAGLKVNRVTEDGPKSDPKVKISTWNPCFPLHHVVSSLGGMSMTDKISPTFRKRNKDTCKRLACKHTHTHTHTSSNKHAN